MYIPKIPNLERGKRITSNIERGQFDIFEKLVEFWRFERDAGERFVTNAFTKHVATGQSNVRMLVSTGCAI